MWEFNYNWVYQVHSDTGSLLIESTAIDEYGESNHDKHPCERQPPGTVTL